MNIYIYALILDAIIMAGSVAICFATHSIWGLLGFFFLQKVQEKSAKDKEATHD